jgi:hypothetical protein
MQSVLSNLLRALLEISTASVLFLAALIGCLGCFPARPMPRPAVATSQQLPPTPPQTVVEKPAAPPTLPVMPPTVPALAKEQGSSLTTAKLYYVTITDQAGSVVARYMVPAGSTIQWPAGSKLLPVPAVKEK